MDQTNFKPSPLVFFIAITALLTVGIVILTTPVLRVGNTGALPIHVSLFAALIGGFLALLSPCSAALLPAFFAYAFKERRRLVEMTFVFFLGLVTVYVPLGFSASLVAKIFINYQGTLFVIAGILFFIFGLMLLFEKSFSFLPSFLRIQSNKQSFGSVYLLGITTGFAAGTCTAPIIGAIITLASTYANPFQSSLLLVVYSLGLALPLFILAYFFDRFKTHERGLLRGKLWTFSIGGKELHVHSTNLIAATLFFLLGFIFILSNGTNSFFGFLTKAGLIDVYFQASQKVLLWSQHFTDWFMPAFIAIAIFFVLVRRKRKPRQPSQNNSI